MNKSMNTAEQAALERLEKAIKIMWGIQGEDVDLPRGQTITQRLEACAEEIEAGN